MRGTDQDCASAPNDLPPVIRIDWQEHHTIRVPASAAPSPAFAEQAIAQAFRQALATAALDTRYGVIYSSIRIRVEGDPDA